MDTEKLIDLLRQAWGALDVDEDEELRAAIMAALKEHDEGSR